MRTQIMRDASYLLPPPGGEVVRDLLDGYDALHARHNALREAVEWERECIDTWEYGTALKMQALDEQVASMRAARAEVDRLIGENK